jgi:cyclopropane fatty-acyl-phospholipid synthase-like methyltransferase
MMNRHMGFPPETRAGTVPAEAIPELAEELRLRPGGTLLDLACGRGAYGLLITKKAGAARHRKGHLQRSQVAVDLGRGDRI